MWVGTGTRLQARKIPANGDQEISILSKLEILREKIYELQNLIEFDSLITSTSFNSSSNVGRVILSDARGARLAIESDIFIADFPTVSSCLTNLQLLPAKSYNDLQVVAENIDSWRTNVVTRIKLYNSTKRSENLILQVISTRIPTVYVNISLIDWRLRVIYLLQIFLLLALQLLPAKSNNDLQVVAENIDFWRTNVVTRIKLYSSTEQLENLILRLISTNIQLLPARLAI